MEKLIYLSKDLKKEYFYFEADPEKQQAACSAKSIDYIVAYKDHGSEDEWATKEFNVAIADLNGIHDTIEALIK